MDKLPLYEIILDEKSEAQGVHFVSLVKQPAISVEWVAFAKANFHPNCRCSINSRGTVKLSKDACETCREARRAFIDARKAGKPAPKGLQWISPDDLNFSSVSAESMEFKVLDADKRMLAGPMLIPDLPIYRRSKDGVEYNVFMTADTIGAIARKFLKENRMGNINEEHTDKMVPAYICEAWTVSNPEKDKSTEFGFSLPKGTFFGIVHVEDETYWNEQVKTGNVKGFSIQGELTKVDEPTNQMEMSEQNFNFARTADGKMIGNADGSEDLKVGDSAVWMNEDGSSRPVEESEVRLEDGSVLVLEAGKVVEIRSADGQPMDATKQEPVEQAADPAMVSREEFDALKNEWATVMADLTARLAALEAEAVAYKETVAKQAEEIKKFSSQTPGAKSVKLSKVAMAKETAPSTKKTGITLAGLEAIENYRKKS